MSNPFIWLLLQVIDLYMWVVIIGVITIVYPCYGGITAVVWNDVLQLVVYVVGAVIAFFLLIDRLPGGWQEITRLAAESDKFQIFDFSFSLAEDLEDLVGKWRHIAAPKEIEQQRTRKSVPR